MTKQRTKRARSDVVTDLPDDIDFVGRSFRISTKGNNTYVQRRERDSRTGKLSNIKKASIATANEFRSCTPRAAPGPVGRGGFRRDGNSLRSFSVDLSRTRIASIYIYIAVFDAHVDSILQLQINY